MKDIIELGKIVGTHGVRGEVRVDNWAEETLWKGLKTVRVGDQEMELTAARPHKSFMLLTLETVDTMDQAMTLKNKIITIAREQINLPKGQYLYCDLYGFSVFDLRTQTEIGTLKEVRETPASLLYVIDRDADRKSVV